MTNDEWIYIGSKLRKRKSDGKPDGDVYFNGSQIPAKKVRKEVSRHYTPVAIRPWVTDIGTSICLYFALPCLELTHSTGSISKSPEAISIRSPEPTTCDVNPLGILEDGFEQAVIPTTIVEGLNTHWTSSKIPRMAYLFLGPTFNNISLSGTTVPDQLHLSAAFDENIP